jgi:hypothetical protein
MFDRVLSLFAALFPAEKRVVRFPFTAHRHHKSIGDLEAIEAGEVVVPLYEEREGLVTRTYFARRGQSWRGVYVVGSSSFKQHTKRK